MRRFVAAFFSLFSLHIYSLPTAAQPTKFLEIDTQGDSLQVRLDLDVEKQIVGNTRIYKVVFLYLKPEPDNTARKIIQYKTYCSTGMTQLVSSFMWNKDNVLTQQDIYSNAPLSPVKPGGREEWLHKYVCNKY